MSNIDITTIDNGNVLHSEGVFSDELLTLAGADELAAGTILARDTTTLKFVLFVKGGVAAGNGIPGAVLTYPLSSTTGGSHDEAVRLLLGGKVKLERLVIDADGDASNIDGAVIDGLRAKGLQPVSVAQLGVLDNGAT